MIIITNIYTTPIFRTNIKFIWKTHQHICHKSFAQFYFFSDEKMALTARYIFRLCCTGILLPQREWQCDNFRLSRYTHRFWVVFSHNDNALFINLLYSKFQNLWETSRCFVCSKCTKRNIRYTVYQITGPTSKPTMLNTVGGLLLLFCDAVIPKLMIKILVLLYKNPPVPKALFLWYLCYNLLTCLPHGHISCVRHAPAPFYNQRIRFL